MPKPGVLILLWCAHIIALGLSRFEKRLAYFFTRCYTILNQFRVALPRSAHAVSCHPPTVVGGDIKLALEHLMKMILFLSIFFSLIALPALGELTDADLDKIRLIVKEEIKTETTIINSKIDGLDVRLRNVEMSIAELRGRSIAISVIKDWGVALCALGALVVSIIALRKKQPTVRQTPQDTQKAVSQ